MGKIILILFIICLVSSAKTGLWAMQREIYSNCISHKGYRSLSIQYKSLVYVDGYKAGEVITYLITCILKIEWYTQTCLTKFCTIILHMGTW